MDRRAFIYATTGMLALIEPIAAAIAQTATSVRRIGLLSADVQPTPVEGVWAPWREAGWIEGQNLLVERRYANNRPELLKPFASISSAPARTCRFLIAAPAAFVVLLLAKMATKIGGVYPVTRQFGSPRGEGMYTTLLMSTGLTFGSISALYGLTHRIVDAAQYSYLVAAVIGSAAVPTLIANAFFLPHHLLPHKAEPGAAAAPATSAASEGESR